MFHCFNYLSTKMLIVKIKEYLNGHTIQELYNNTGISTGVFYSLLKRDWKKYNKNTLDILYSFFRLDRDEFYNNNLKKWYPKTLSLFGTLVRYKRVRKNIDIDELARMMKIEKRALCRLESWDALPTFDSWTIQHLIIALDFTKEEIENTKKYIDNMKRLEKTVKKYEI